MIKRVLVVDDNYVNRMLIVEALSRLAVCDEAGDGEEALEKYLKDQKGYAIIFLDIAMPRMDGVEVLKQIRQNEDRLNVPNEERMPVILVTGFPDRVPEGLEHGAGDYIVKPIIAEVLIHKFQQFSR